MTGITPVENLWFSFNITSSSWLTWSHPFENYPLSYHIYIENQHGQLLYNDITNDTSYELYNLTVCDIYTATVIAHSGGYNSSNVTTQDQYNGSMLINCLLIINYFTEYITIFDYNVIFYNHSFDVAIELNVTVRKQ